MLTSITLPVGTLSPAPVLWNTTRTVSLSARIVLSERRNSPREKSAYRASV